MISVSRSVSRLVSRSVLSGQSNDLASIMKKLFANNEQGFAYDPNDLSTMFQDAAGAVPVTAAGQPVGLILDKSGRNNHAFQSTSASRPILRKNAVTGANYLEFDGSDDFLMLSPFTLPSPFTLIASLDYTKTAVGAVFSGGVAGYLRSGITSAGVHSVASPLTVSKGGKDTLTHSSKDAFVTLKSNMETASLPIAESNPFGNMATKWIGTFSETHTPLRCGMGLYGLVAISKSIDSSEENNIRAHFNKRMGI